MAKWMAVLFLPAMLLILPAAFAQPYVADYGSGCGMMGGYGMLGFGLFGLVYVALFSFVFSVIFWLTREWLVNNKEKKR